MPCIGAIPDEKELVGRMEGRPFALLGINTDEDPEVARKVMGEQGITWPNWHDGAPGTGPLAERYRVQGYPGLYLIDDEGKIRAKRFAPTELEQLVEPLVIECEARAGKSE